MNLSVKDAAGLLNVSEKTVYRWIKQGSIPAYRIHETIRFNRVELLEWATSQKIPLDPNILSEPESGGRPLPAVAEAIRSGGVLYRVEGRTKHEVLANVVEHLNLPEEVNREFLLKVLLAREALGSTGVGDGIAIPHVRNPIVLHVSRPSITIAFLEHPIDFGSLDGKPVSILFTLISPTVRAHLHLLSRLAFVLRDGRVRKILEKAGMREAIFSAVGKVEETVACQSARAGRKNSRSRAR